MVDLPPESILGAGGLLALRTLLGPAAGEVGEALRRWVEFRLRNVGRVVENADEKLRAVGPGPGTVSVRTAMAIFEAASYSDDQLMADYLGGVLASSVSPDGRDDRGVTWTAQISRMSSYALRIHYICYSTARALLVAADTQTLREARARESASLILIPTDDVYDAMEFGADEDAPVLVSHAIVGLHREGLIDRQYGMGSLERLSERLQRKFPSGGLVFSPSPAGIELFLWAHGRGRDTSIESFLDPTSPLSFEAVMQIPTHAVRLSTLESTTLEEQNR